jgi:hypothetical protein
MTALGALVYVARYRGTGRSEEASSGDPPLDEDPR